MSVKRIFLSLMIFSASLGLFSEDLFTKGQKLLVENRFEEALPLLESSLVQNPGNGLAYIYVSFLYQKFQRSQEAIDLLQRGTAEALSGKSSLYFNLGELYSIQKDYKNAIGAYEEALRLDGSKYGAVLGKANSELMLKKFPESIQDYELYLQLNPQTPQRENIEMVLAKLKQFMLDEEERKRLEEEERLAEEARRRQEEEDRQRAEEEARRLEEERRKAEEARQQALLDEILKSLEDAGDDTQNISADSEGLETYNDVIDIED